MPALPRWAWAAILFVVALALILLLVECSASDRAEQAVTLDRAQIEADAAARALQADRTATANQQAADAAFTNSQEALRDEVRTKGTDAPVGPAVTGVLDRLRSEQARAARRDPAR